MNIPGLITGHIAAVNLAPYSIVKPTADDGVVTPAGSGTEPMSGVTTNVGTTAGKHADVVRSGLSPVRYGGSIRAGYPITADENGHAVEVTLPVTETTFIVGYAEVAGADGDIGSANIMPSVLAATSGA